jgi:hypothetical protein
MNKLKILLLFVVLLAACQPAATSQPVVVPPTLPPESTSTPAPVEALASSVDDLLGIWWYPKAGMKLEFNADGTVRAFSGSANIGTIDEGKYTFDNGKVIFTGSAVCDINSTTYEAYVTKQDDERISLRLQVIGTDACADRAKALEGVGKFQNP